MRGGRRRQRAFVCLVLGGRESDKGRSCTYREGFRWGGEDETEECARWRNAVRSCSRFRFGGCEFAVRVSRFGAKKAEARKRERCLRSDFFFALRFLRGAMPRRRLPSRQGLGDDARQQSRVCPWLSLDWIPGLRCLGGHGQGHL